MHDKISLILRLIDVSDEYTARLKDNNNNNIPTYKTFAGSGIFF